jgi:hypothetical protein
MTTAFSKSSGSAFIKSPGSVRGRVFPAGVWDYRVASAFWNVSGFLKFDAASGWWESNWYYQDSWPVIYRRRTSVFSFPAGGYNAGPPPSFSTELNGTISVVFPTFFDSPLAPTSPVTTTTGDLFSTFVSWFNYFNPADHGTLTVTDTSVSISVPVYDNSSNLVGTATMVTTLDEQNSWGSDTASCLALLAGIEIPTSSNTCQNVFSGASTPFTDSLQYYIGLSAKGVPFRPVTGGYGVFLQTICNSPWAGAKGGWGGGGRTASAESFLICTKSKWIIPAGLAPPGTASGLNPWPSPIVNAFGLGWTLGGDGLLTPASSVITKQGLTVPGTNDFDPSQISETYGELGLRNSLVA